MSKAESRTRKLAEKLKAALMAAPIVRAWSYYGAMEAEFDAAKRDRLKTIARRARPDIAEDSLNDLLLKTSFALEGLLAMKKHGQIKHGQQIEHGRIEHGRIKKVQEELTKLRQAGACFISAWQAIQFDHYLKRAVELHFEGRLGLTPLPASMPAKKDEALALTLSTIRARRDGIDRIDAVVEHDLPQLAADLGRLIEVLQKARRIKKAAEHICVFQIACAWRDNIGAVPTLTRNKEAVAGPQQTNF